MEAKECQNLFLFFILTSAILVDSPITQSCPNLILRSRSFQALCDKLVSTKKPVSQTKENQEKKFYSIFIQLLQFFSRIRPVSSVAKNACTGYIENPWRDPQSYLNLQTLTERKFVTETKTFRPPASRKTTEESL